LTTSHRQRKEDHLRICLEEDVAFRYPSSGFELVQLPHLAAPEMALEDVDISTRFLGHVLRAPLLISSMTGGTEWARTINRNLAQAAQELGIALALGSLRAALEDAATISTYQVRDIAPDVFLCANLGAVQLNYGYDLEHCRRAVELIGADALILHLNPLQEALQPGGNTNFRGLLDKIAAVCAGLPVPVIVKEVGWGISGELARQLHHAGAAAIDVAGAGGTSWSQVEMYRAPDESARRIAQAFEDWGIPTVQALMEARRAVPGAVLIASGGLRSGVDVAKALALGAQLAGIAHPLLRLATQSAEAVIGYLQEIIQELRIAMFCTGSRTLRDLPNLPIVVRSAPAVHRAGTQQ
jgi:isopentenyl-diphosphate delta-isomerase